MDINIRAVGKIYQQHTHETLQTANCGPTQLQFETLLHQV